MAQQKPRENEVGPGWTIGTFLGLMVLAVAVVPFFGLEQIPFRALWGNPSTDPAADILWKLRIPRVLMALIAGSALATSGMAFQAMFRNPLATPFTLGVSSGAALGAVVAIHCGWTFTLLGFSSVSLLAFLGAVTTIVLVYVMTARSGRGPSTSTMLLAGVATSFFFSSMILFLQYTSDPSRAFRMLQWTLGGLEGIVSIYDVLSVFPFMAAGSLTVWYLTLDLNLLMTGEEFAFSRGVHVGRVKLLLFVAVSLMVGAVVAVCGPIGFVGLMAPHICRLLIGYDHRWLFPATFFFGGAFLVICDTIARMLMAPMELPVGIITALLGGPFFLWLLLARKQDFEA